MFGQDLRKARQIDLHEAADQGRNRDITRKSSGHEVFHSLFGDSPDRNELVVTFLAVLELGRLQKIRVLQHMVYGTIYVVLRDKLNFEMMQKLFESGDSYAYQRPAEQPARV